jgi:hypothetical protein
MRMHEVFVLECPNCGRTAEVPVPEGLRGVITCPHCRSQDYAVEWKPVEVEQT